MKERESHTIECYLLFPLYVLQKKAITQKYIDVIYRGYKKIDGEMYSTEIEIYISGVNKKLFVVQERRRE